MNKYNFTGIGPRSSFFANAKRNYLSAEWWHFQDEEHLIDRISLFGTELLRVYDEDVLAKSPVWPSRKAIFVHRSFRRSFNDYLRA